MLMRRRWEQGDGLMIVSREQGGEQNLAATDSHEQTHSMHKLMHSYHKSMIIGHSDKMESLRIMRMCACDESA